MVRQEAANDRGEPIAAARIGSEMAMPLTESFYLMHSDIDEALTFDETANPPVQCMLQNRTTLCRKVRLKGIGMFKTIPIPQGTVTFTPSVQQVVDGVVTYVASSSSGTVGPTETMGGGRYQARYTGGAVPRMNYVVTSGTGTVTVPESLYVLVGTEGLKDVIRYYAD